MEIDATQVVVALIGFIGVGLGLLLNRRGQRRQESVQDAANRLAERKQHAEEQDRLITRLYAEIDRLGDLITRERLERRERLAARDEACDRSRQELVGTIAQLAGMIRDEVAQEAARFAIDHAARHDRDEH